MVRRRLLEGEVQVNATDSTGRTALMFAANGGHVEVTEIGLGLGGWGRLEGRLE